MTSRRIWTLALLFTALAVLGFIWYKAIDRRCAPLVLKDISASQPLRAPAFSEKKVIRILSINGGGVRGIIPLTVLKYLEEQNGRRTSEMFDLITGVSVGGIIAAGTLLPGPEGRSRYSAEEILREFHRLIPEVFNPAWPDILITCDGILAPKYSSKRKQQALRNMLGDIAFGDLMKPCLLMGFDMQNGRPQNLESWQSPWNGFAVADLLNAGTTFPGVFNPVLLQTGVHELPMLTDVGTVENDPSLAALQLARQAAPDARIILVNLGTGEYSPDPNTSSLNRWGELRWITTLLPAISSGNVQVTKRNMKAEETYMGEGRFIYYSVDVAIPAGRFYHPFNGSAQNVANISQLAEDCVKRNEAKLREIAALLVQSTE